MHSTCIAKDYPEDTSALVNDNDIDNRRVRSFGSNSSLLSGGAIVLQGYEDIYNTMPNDALNPKQIDLLHRP